MTTTGDLSPQPKKRSELIAAIEQERRSKVLTYFLSDRRGAAAQVAEDAVRPMYDHLKAMGKAARVDLFLYSVGGLTDVPWRIVSMIREFARSFSVLIPYKAHSAATMIALGADEIVMGPKGELGPIDPQFSIKRTGEGGTAVQEQIAIEDIMSYVRFIREKAGLSDQTALAGPISALANKMEPWILGQANRAHSHIRLVARKLLTARSKGQAPDEQRIQVIVETLAEKTYQHGHAIGRQEAEEVGLKIHRPSARLENLMWELHEEYENMCRLRDPIDQWTFIPAGQDEHTEDVLMGAIESVPLSHLFRAGLVIRHRRQMPPQLTLNLNLNLQLPAGIQPEQVPQATQQAAQQIMQQLQQQAQILVQQEVRKQAPTVGFEMRLQNGAWRKTADWPGGA